jgi:hypothetical protein
MRAITISAINLKALVLVREHPGVDLAGLAQALYPERRRYANGKMCWQPGYLVAGRMTKLRKRGLAFYKFLPDPFEGRPERPKKCWFLTDKGFEICEQFQPTSSPEDGAGGQGDGASLERGEGDCSGNPRPQPDG